MNNINELTYEDVKNENTILQTINKYAICRVCNGNPSIEVQNRIKSKFKERFKELSMYFCLYCKDEGITYKIN